MASRVKPPGREAAPAKPALRSSEAALPATFVPNAAEAAQRKLRTLEAILASKNDNDSRLDTDFNHLSREAKALFRKQYLAIPPEMRNDRGTIVYILGKPGNLTAPEDWAFLKGVAEEPPCLSLEDCSSPMNASVDREEPGLEVTLAYPQLVALKQMERVLTGPRAGGSSPETLEEARAVVEAGASSPSPQVARLARRILQILSK